MTLRRCLFAPALALIALAAGCSVEDAAQVPAYVPVPPLEHTGTYGMAIDPTSATATFSAALWITGADGKIPAASLALGGKTYSADARGFLVVSGVKPTAPPRVTVKAKGYVPLPLALDFGSSGAAPRRVVLLTASLQQEFDAAAGITAKADSAQITLPAAGLATATGAAYTGKATLSARYVEPFKEAAAGGMAKVQALAAALPTTYALAKDSAGKLRPLLPMAALDAAITSDKGEALQLASGKPASVTLPLPSFAAKVFKSGAKTTLWSYDAATGLLAANGDCTVTVATDGSVSCAGSVTHFSTTTVAVEMNALSCARVSEVRLVLPQDYSVSSRHDRIEMAPATSHPGASTTPAAAGQDVSAVELPSETRYTKDASGALGYYGLSAAPGHRPVYFRVQVQLDLVKGNVDQPHTGVNLSDQSGLVTYTTSWMRAQPLAPADTWKDEDDAWDACKALTGEPVVIWVTDPRAPTPAPAADQGVPDGGLDGPMVKPDAKPDMATPDMAAPDMAVSDTLSDLPVVTDCATRCAKVGICHGYPVPGTYTTEAQCVSDCKSGDITEQSNITACVAGVACTKAAILGCYN